MKRYFKFLVPLVIALNITTSGKCELIEIVNKNRIIVEQIDRLQKIKESGVLTVLSPDDEPYSYKDPKTGAFRGLDAEIITELANRLGVKKVNVRYTTFSNALEELAKNPNIDLVAESLYITDERKKLVNFTNPIYTGNDVILTRKDTNISRKEDLKNAKVGVLGGTVYVSLAENWKSQGLLGEYVTFFDDDSLRIALENDTVDAIITDSIIAVNFILSKPNLNFRLLSPTQYKSEIDLPLAYPLKKEDVTLISAINEKLQEMKNDGSLYEILARYGISGNYIP